jgi:N-acetylglutamate synthase/N-acetylornithine aminotransferase
MALAFTEQRSNINKNEEPKQEEVNQGLNEAMVGVAKELVAVLEGRTRAILEETRVQAAARRNAALAWLVEQSLAMPRRVAPEW